MRRRVNLISTGLLASLVFIIAFSSSVTYAQDPQQETSATINQDPISRLNLTPEQRQRIRAIRSENKEERAAITQRVQTANEALEKALDADNPNEAEVEQRLQELAAAQAASNRIRVLTELRIRRVLTPEQTALWKSLRAENVRRRQEVQKQRNAEQNGGRLRPNQQNGLTPLNDRRTQPNKNPR